jgi:DNA-binding response OmpR family regulator
MPTPDVVAVINSTPDAVDLVKDVLEQAGFLVVSAFTWDIQAGRSDLKSMIETHQPKVIIYDIAPPYERNWAFLQHLRTTVLTQQRFVLTSMNVKHVERLVGRDERVYEIVGKPHDLDEIVRATREALRARDTQ